MEGISEGSDTFFSISPAEIAGVKAYALTRDSIEGRLDTQFNHPHYKQLNLRLDETTVPTPELGELLVSISSGATPKRGDASLYADSGIRFLRILNVEDGEILEGDLKYITPEVHHGQLQRSQLAVDDILMTITGRVGSAAVVREDHLPANINQHVVRMRADERRCRPGFLAEWLNSPAGLELSNRYVSGGTRSALDYEAIRKIRVPLPNSLETQDSLLSVMDTARSECKTKLAAADALLMGIDNFVLDALGIDLNVQQRSVFATSTADIQGSRFDSDFHSLRFRTIRNGIERGRYPSKSIDELCQYITSGFAAGPQDQAFGYENGIPHLRPLNLDVFGQVSLDGTKFVPTSAVAEDNRCIRDEVLFNNTNSTEMVGKSAVFDLEQPCACSNHITRLKPHSGVNAEHIASALNALRRIGYLGLLSTNFNNQAGINATTLSQLHLPTPPMEEQNAIAAEVRRRREKSRRLQVEAESEWRDAKNWFEEQLLS